jgi:hypothetical protein
MIPSFVKSSKYDIRVKSFANAISVIIKDYYIKENLDFDFLIVCRRKCRNFPFDVLTEILMKNLEYASVKVRVTKETYNKSKKYKLERSSIIFLPDERSNPFFDERTEMIESLFKKYQYHIVYEKLYKEIIVPSPSHFALNQLKINYEIFLYQNVDHLELVTLKTFFKEDCGTRMYLLNEFSIKNQTWKGNDFGLIETKTFNGCPLYISDGSNLNILNPFVKKVVTEISSKLNFIPEFKTLRELQSILGNPRYNRWCNKMSIGIATLLISDSLRYSGKSEYNSSAFVYTSATFALLVPLGDKYSSYEKFLLPFDYQTWICCLFIFGITFMIIIFINRSRNKVLQDKIYGPRVNSPSFNILIAFFGQSQVILPEKSFARLILMIFILFCLIIRTSYQGVQFDLMYTVSFIKIKIFLFP